MASYGKPRDRVSAFTKTGNNQNWAIATASENYRVPNSDAILKKKHYRARGCRGGASRKGRKKQQYRLSHDDREARENLDPSPNGMHPACFGEKHIQAKDQGHKEILVENRRHNTVTEKYSFQNNIDPSKEGQKRHNFIYTSKKYGSDAIAAFAGRNSNKSVPQVKPQVYGPSMSILPKESDGNIELLLGYHTKNQDLNAALGDENSNFKRAHSPMHHSGINADRESAAPSPGGFSFFSISPRSYLTGRKSKTQKLN